METEELIEHILRQKHLEEMMNRPEKEHTPLEGMDNEQIKRFALFLFEENQKKSRQLDEMIARLDEIGKDLKEVKRENASLLKALLEANSNAEKVVLEYKLRDKEYRKLEKKHNALVERLSLMNTQTYASSKSLKGIDHKRVVKGKHDDKDDFDGTPTAPAGEVPQSDSAASCDAQDTPATPHSKERPYRKGMRYNKNCVGTPIIHKSDYTMLPEGSVVISSSYRKIRNIVSHIEEHHFEVLKVKHADGRIESMFLPMKDDARADIYNEIVPGTSITANMLSYLTFNRFQMSTSAYREAKNRLSDMEHLCCLAHARAKFKYAFDQGSLQARIFLELIGKLYGMEDTYRREKLTADEIYHRRNSKETTEIIDKIRTELYDLLANPDESRSELMGKALKYLKNFWNQIFAYRNDGEYSIDNMAAERAIRPITVQRKNSLFFGSVKGIQNSAIYNTFIETCKQVGVSFRDYFCRLLRELKKGRTDYENLLPMTICK